MLLLAISGHHFRNPSLDPGNHTDQMLSWDSRMCNLHKHLPALLVLQLWSPELSVLSRSQKLQEPPRLPSRPTWDKCLVSLEAPAQSADSCPSALREEESLPRIQRCQGGSSGAGLPSPLHRCGGYSIILLIVSPTQCSWEHLLCSCRRVTIACFAPGAFSVWLLHNESPINPRVLRMYVQALREDHSDTF